ncbi:MAG: dienelactone hydrolase family protein [Cyclobacteriaceae bacterium]
MKKLTYTLVSILLIGACSAPSKEKATEEIIVPVGEVQYSSDSTNLNGYFALDQSSDAKRPGVLVIHEWWGHNEHSRKQAEKLAKLGYVAFALDMYGDGKNTEHPDDAGKFMTAVVSNMDVAKARFESALEQLKNHPNVDSEKIGVIGFCFGGTMALSMANAGYDIDGVAAFHAGLGLPIMPGDGAVKAKILVANGADDPWVSEQQVEDFKAAMDGAGASYKYIAYEGATHAFTNEGADALGEQFGLPLAYNAAADSASWEEMKILFSEVF